MSRINLLVLVLLIVGCQEAIPDADVQFSFERTDFGREAYVEAAGARAELGSSLSFELVVSDPDVFGVTWRDAEQWRILQKPAGSTYCSADDCSAVCESGVLAFTARRIREIWVGQCVDENMSGVIRHEIGHALGAAHVIGDPSAVMRPSTKRGEHDPHYTERDVDQISSVRRDETNTIWEHVWID